jgi:hypothetical protein
VPEGVGVEIAPSDDGRELAGAARGSLLELKLLWLALTDRFDIEQPPSQEPASSSQTKASAEAAFLHTLRSESVDASLRACSASSGL